LLGSIRTLVPLTGNFLLSTASGSYLLRIAADCF
jgi:hypothetical protein